MHLKYYKYQLTCWISQYLLGRDTGVNVAVIVDESDVAVEVIVGNILPKIPVLGIGVSSKVVGLLLVISINILEFGSAHLNRKYYATCKILVIRR